MKKNILGFIAFVLLASCGGSGTKTTERNKVLLRVVDANL